MNWKIGTGRLLIALGAVLWARWAITMDVPGQLPSEERAGTLGLLGMGALLAWGLWRRLDLYAAGEAQLRRRRREVARALDPRHELTPDQLRGDAPIPMGTRLDLGPCPHCGGGPATVMPAPPGVVLVRCRGCGLEAAPPELQPTSRGTPTAP